MEKRRLPLLKGPLEDAGGEPPRPPWQWVGFGTVAIFVAWLPLSWLAGAVAARLAASPGLQAEHAALFVAALGLGSLAGGFVVGRWGTEGVGVREAAFAGLAAGLAATFLSWASLGLSLGSLVTVLVSAPGAGLGGWLGVRRRGRIR